MANKVLTEQADAFEWTRKQVLAGKDGDDTISALGGDDMIIAGNGNNTVYAGFGDDIVTQSESAPPSVPGVQVYYGGVGSDFLRGGALGDLLSGDKDDDTLYGEAGHDTLYGGSGNDVLRAYGEGNALPFAGRDVMFGGEGNDFIDIYNTSVGGLYTARVYGGAGDDEVLAGDGANEIYGGEGRDTVYARLAPVEGQDAARFDGGAGIDRLTLDITEQGVPGVPTIDDVVMTRRGAGVEVAVNGEVLAQFTGFENLSISVDGNSTLLGGSGNDLLSVAGGDASVKAGRGFDRVQVFAPAELAEAGPVYDLDGGEGRDQLVVFGAGQMVFGSGQAVAAIRLDLRGALGVLQVGDGPEGRVVGFEQLFFSGSGLGDTVFSGAGNDTITEVPAGQSSGADEFHGGDGDDNISAGDQNDAVYGDAGNDTLLGGQGRDLILGGAGSDEIIGGLEADRMYGQGGADVFIFDSAFDSQTQPGEIDNIFDFTTLADTAAEADKIDLSALGDLTFIGTDSFTAAGQVRAYQAAEGTFVMVNLEGTSGPEIKIALIGVTASELVAADFIL